MSFLWFIHLFFSLHEPNLHQKICCIQILLSYLAGFCTAWSLSAQVFRVARVIHVSFVKTVQTQKMCLILFYLLLYFCLICFPGMDWWARNNSFFIFLDNLEGGDEFFISSLNIGQSVYQMQWWFKFMLLSDLWHSIHALCSLALLPDIKHT